MPTLSHEALVQLVRNAPAIVPMLLWPEERRTAPTWCSSAERIARTALEVARSLDGERGMIYPDFVFALLLRAAPAILEKIMALPSNWEPQSEYFREIFRRARSEGRAEGRAEGEAEMLLKLLRLKGFVFSEALRQRVLECRDTAQLETWAGRVLTAQGLDEVFADG